MKRAGTVSLKLGVLFGLLLPTLAISGVTKNPSPTVTAASTATPPPTYTPAPSPSATPAPSPTGSPSPSSDLVVDYYPYDGGATPSPAPSNLPVVSITTADGCDTSPSYIVTRLADDFSGPLNVFFTDGTLASDGSLLVSTITILPGDSSATIPVGSDATASAVSLLPDPTYTLSGYYAPAMLTCFPPQPPPPPTMRIIGPDGNAPANLRVSRWEGAFTNDLARLLDDVPPIALRAGFEMTDDRRFYLIVTDAAQAGQANVTVNLATAGPLADYNQAATAVTLNALKPGSPIFLSRPLILVSDTVDRDNNAAQHFLVALGHTVTATYGAITSTATVPIDKRVTLNVSVIARANGTAVLTQDSVTADLKVANERYAQAGIQFTWNAAARFVAYRPVWRLNGANIVAIPKPVAIDPPPRFQFYQVQAGAAAETAANMMVDERNLLDQTGVRSANASVVNIIYVPGMLYTTTDNSVLTFPLNNINDIDKLLTFRGSAWITGQVPNGYGNTCLVNSGNTNAFVVPHEVGHLLSRQGHSDYRSHLMNMIVSTTNTVTSTKRIPLTLQTTMQRNIP